MPSRSSKVMALGLALAAGSCAWPVQRSGEPHALPDVPQALTSSAAGTLANLELRASGSELQIQLRLGALGRTLTAAVALQW